MTAMVRTELLKLVLTRATWALVAVAVLLAVLRVEIVLGSVGTVGSAAPGSQELTLTVVGVAGAGLPVVLLLGVLSMTWEWRHATLTPALLATPDRRRVLAAKSLAAALVGMALTAMSFLYPVVRGLLAGAIEPRLDGPLAQLLVGGVLGAALWGWLGVAIGAVVRNQTLALLLPLLWILVVETLLPAFGLGRVVPWTPLGGTSALGGADFAGALPVWGAGLLLVAYATAFTVPGTYRLVRADVT